MPLSINNNSMAQNASGNLNGHYARLSTSVRRLSTGLRINCAADDAAGLAIRELMRSDVAALNQGMRNANDAISMLQAADGALAIIDEKLIRMKELAEQAATGTYNSIQRLMIASEYQAMADEIDRIARATSFNGIKLLDGSLSGPHDGSGMTSSGALKIHFGPGNDSAEDYYQAQVGDCTANALGVGSGAVQNGQTVTWIEVETQKEVTAAHAPQDKYDVYVAPNGWTYYKVDDFYCQYLSDPYGSRLTNETIIAQLTRHQHEKRTTIDYRGYVDPDTGTEYYLSQGFYTSDPYDPAGKRLDAANPDQKAILDRLERDPGNKTLEVNINWKVWSDHGQYYYSYNNGNTFVPDPDKPSSGVLDKNNPDDAALIDKFEVVLGEYAPSLPQVEVTYKVWTDPRYNKTYYSKDGGVTFQSRMGDPDSALDPVRDRDILARLEKDIEYTWTSVSYSKYTDPVTGYLYYTSNNQIYLRNPNNPAAGQLDAANAADALVIANLQAVEHNMLRSFTCATYEDTSDNNKLYYSWDSGATFFSDLSDPSGSIFTASDPAHAGTVANLNRISSTVQISQTYTTYYDEVTLTKYYTPDGATFYRDPARPSIVLDPVKDAVILGRLKVYPDERNYNTHFYSYTDPVTGIKYYTPDNKNTFYDIADLTLPVLSSSSPDDKTIIDRLEANHKSWTHMEYMEGRPAEVQVYKSQGKYYYSGDGGKTFATSMTSPFLRTLDPSNPADKQILDAMQPVTTMETVTEYIKEVSGDGIIPDDGAVISTQEAAQKALAAIDRAIVSKDRIRANLGALQNRLENTVANLSLQSENLQAAECRVSDADVAREMTQFIRSQVLTQAAVSMLGQANSYPHILFSLLSG